MRDSQRRKLYDAENEWVRETKSDADRLDSIDAARDFIERVWRSEYIKSKFPAIRAYEPPRLTDGRGTTWARGSLTRINLPLWARTRHIALHELAHALPAHLSDSEFKGGAAHGRQFAARLMLLVRHFMGKVYADALKHAYKRHRVKFRPKRKLSPETLERLRAHGVRLAAKRKVESRLDADAERMLEFLRGLEKK